LAANPGGSGGIEAVYLKIRTRKRKRMSMREKMNMKIKKKKNEIFHFSIKRVKKNI